MPTTPPELDPEMPPAEDRSSSSETHPTPTQPQVPELGPESRRMIAPAPEADQQASAAMRIRTRRYGELEAHELIHLLDSIEDERARARFRESLYISAFIWIAIAVLVLYGPNHLWHSPQLISPAEAMKQHELLTLNNPVLPHAPVHAPKVDRGTLERLRKMSPPAAPTPPAPTPTPQPEAPKATQPAPQPTQPSQPLPSAPTPAQPSHSTAPPVADAPLPQPSAPRPSFNTGGSVSDSMRDLANNVARGRGSLSVPGGGGFRGSNRGTQVGQGVDILSDTKGVDFQPYIARIMREIYEQWIPLLPEEARPPLNKQGITMIRFSINPDGTIGAMHLDGSTHDVALDRAAWGSITGVNQFPPLPKQFTGPNLELRIHYLVNEDPNR